jgi:hypothetical protein
MMLAKPFKLRNPEMPATAAQHTVTHAHHPGIADTSSATPAALCHSLPPMPDALPAKPQTARVVNRNCSSLILSSSTTALHHAALHYKLMMMLALNSLHHIHRWPTFQTMTGTKLTLPRIDSIIQAKQLQRLSHETAIQLEKDLASCCSAETRALLVRSLRDAVSAWDTARDAVRILKGKGLPTRVPEKPSRKKLHAGSYQILDLEDVTTKPAKMIPEKTPEPEPEPGRPADEDMTETG